MADEFTRQNVQRSFYAFSLRKIAKKFKLGASLLNKMKIS